MKAALAVCAEREMSKEQIEREIFEEFQMAVGILGLSPALQGVSREILLRSKNYVVKACKVDGYHDGESIFI